MQLLNIGEAAAAAGVTPKMIRHYEVLGLIPEPPRTEAGYRLYGEREVAMLRFIRQSRSLGFSMQQIESLLSMWRNPDRESREVRAVAMQQLGELEERQRELDQMRKTLEELVSRCPGDHGAACAILDKLASPPAPLSGEASARAKKSLKEVRPGERRATRRSRSVMAPPAQVPHAALTAWARTISH